MDKILITGGTGLFGLNFALRQSKNYKIYLVQNKKRIKLSKKLENIYLLKKDLNKKKNIKKILNKIKPNYVIHAAAITNLEYCQKYKTTAKKVNYTLTKNITNECKEKKYKLIYLSSDQLFEGKNSYYSESSKTFPLNFYSKLKIASENYIIKNLKDFLIIRTNFFGWGSFFRSSFSDNIIFNLKKKKKIHILKDVYFNPISLNYLTKAISKLISNKKNGIYNISSSKKISKYNLAKKIAKTFKLNERYLSPIRLNNLESNVVRPRNMSLNNVKIRKIFTMPSIEYQIKNLFKEYKNKSYKKFKNIKTCEEEN